MRKMTILICMLCGMVTLRAQMAELDFNQGLMVSNLSSIAYRDQRDYAINGPNWLQYHERTTDLLQVVPTFLWKNQGGNFMEVSIPKFRFRDQRSTVIDTAGQLVTGMNVRNVDLALQYAYSVRFFKKKSSKWLPMLGFELTPFFSRVEVKPVGATGSLNRNTYFGIDGSVRPHVMWLPTKRLFLDFGASFTLFDLEFATINSTNPSNPNILDQSGYTNYNAFPGLVGLRLGAGVRI